MKRIGKSKFPIAHQIPEMLKNLSTKHSKSVQISMDIWQHNAGNATQEFKISFIPGFTNNACSQYYFKTWPELLTYYQELLKRET